MLPDVEFVFVGYSNVSGGGGRRPDWREERDEVLSLPNVRQVAAVAQDKVPQHYWSFALTWIPYAVDHEFNYASCPTKIMDGLASGRPVLSTDIPECRLYRRMDRDFRYPEQAAEVISRQLARLGTPPAARDEPAPGRVCLAFSHLGAAGRGGAGMAVMPVAKLNRLVCREAG